MRDLIAYLLVVVIIVAVAYDGIVSQTSSSTVLCFYKFNIQVYLLEACLFPVLYFVYLVFVITVSYIRVSLFL